MPVYASAISSESSGLQSFLISAPCGDHVGGRKHRRQVNLLAFGGAGCSVGAIMDGASNGFRP